VSNPRRVVLGESFYRCAPLKSSRLRLITPIISLLFAAQKYAQPFSSQLIFFTHLQSQEPETKRVERIFAQQKEAKLSA
jgi:hypothetical protein